MKKKFDEWTGPSRQILCKHGINPYTGCENLTITRNWCHSADYAERVYNALVAADAKGMKTDIEDALDRMAEYHAKCNDPGKADEKTDVALNG